MACDREIPLKVINIMKRFCPTMERSSIDECYLDLTEISRRYRNATDKSQLPNCWLSGCETVEESVEAIIDSGPSSDFSVQSHRTVPVRKSIPRDKDVWRTLIKMMILIEQHES